MGRGCPPPQRYLSICLSRSCAVSRQLRISSNFFSRPCSHTILVAKHSSFFYPKRRYTIPRTTPQRGRQMHRGGIILRISLITLVLVSRQHAPNARGRCSVTDRGNSGCMTPLSVLAGAIYAPSHKFFLNFYPEMAHFCAFCNLQH